MSGSRTEGSLEGQSIAEGKEGREAGVWVLLTELYSSVSPAQSQLPHEAERAQRPGHRVLRGPTEMFSFLLKPEEN